MMRFEYPLQKDSIISKLIIFKSLLSPKITNKNFNSIPRYVIDKISAYIWNKSIEALVDNNNLDILLNKYLAYEETKLFCSKELLNEFIFSGHSLILDSALEKDLHKNFSYETPVSLDQIQSVLLSNNYNLDNYNDNQFNNLSSIEKLYVNMKLSFPFNLSGLLQIYKISEESITSNNLFFKRLAIIEEFLQNNEKNSNLLESTFEFSQTLRTKLKSSYPPNLVLIVEGITEEILLPTFAKKLSFDFNTYGIFLISAGGKNQVCKLYNKYKHILKLPIAVLLDNDAKDIALEIGHYKRSIDKVMLIENGEFEDILSLDLICKSMNNEFMLSPSICYEEIDPNISIVAQLTELWRSKGLGDFSKSQFANIINRHIYNEKDCSEYLQTLIQDIKSLLF